MKNVIVLGNGAIGAYCSAKLEDANFNIKVLCDANRKKRYEKDKFYVNDKMYDFSYITAEDKVDFKADLVIIALKYNYLEDGLMLLKNYIDENTIIMSLLNGINSEDIIMDKLKTKNILYSFIVGIDAVRVNNKINYTNEGHIVFGNKDNKQSKELLEVKNIFEESKIPYIIPENILNKMWLKFMMNVGSNQLSAILKANYKAFKNCENLKNLVYKAMMEVIELSKYEGANLTNEDIDLWYETLNKMSDEGMTSMMQDILAKRDTEVEMFAKVVCNLGKKHNIDVSTNEIIYDMIKTIEWINKNK